MKPYSKEAAILHLLDIKPGQYGLELVRHSRGAIGRGTVYVVLGRMEDKGLVSSEQEARPRHASGCPRRMYSMTSLGRSELAAIRAGP